MNDKSGEDGTGELRRSWRRDQSGSGVKGEKRLKIFFVNVLYI